MFKIEKHLADASINRNATIEKEFDTVYQREVLLNSIKKEIIAKQAELEAIEKAAIEKEMAVKNHCKGLVERARQEIEVLKKDAWNEGYQLGREEAQEIIDDAQTAKKNEMERFMTQIARMREETWASSESEIIDFCISMAEKVVCVALDKDDELYLNMIKNALTKIKCDSLVQVSMSRQDYIKRVNSDTAVFDVQGEQVTVGFTYNDELSEGDCIVETNAERVDASVNTAIKQIKESITKEDLDSNDAKN